ncbi:3-hydroxyacyl-CoA dehydrogenase family protein [Aspergillus puulaauensis]|uniref:3-hydroxyacyl-CoA dehydrogenase n=1 Tax=Aspergillus puulaauensis TaxID=1220207 RepID=A0A7R8AQS2_9EURO|nr:uncharacterized protein APUU_70154S [Aspergillus puulaauensis]BCS28584.1 hypothetical protein APUU_70154S [Aspergillus puulaauensis]
MAQLRADKSRIVAVRSVRTGKYVVRNFNDMSKVQQKCVTLLGAGTQGARLAYMWSRCGSPVNLIDKSQKQLELAGKKVLALREEGSVLGLLGGQWGDVTPATSEKLKHAIWESWLVIECVPESLSLKRAVAEELDQLAGPETIIASNSSSYTITEILEGLKTKYPDRLLSLHSCKSLLPPAQSKPKPQPDKDVTDWPPETSAIEIMGSGNTRPDIISLLKRKTGAHGFEPFHVQKPSMGYIYNRIWAAIKREALFALDEGVASPQEIDGIFKAVLKTPKGPCEQMDVVGLDVVLDIENHYADVRPGLPEEPRKYLQQMIAQGRLGVKTGSGFFEYGNTKK